MSDRNPGRTAARPGIQRQNWSDVERSLDSSGHALLPGLISPKECQQLMALYEDEKHFRARISMSQHGFGSGEYKYFAYPLPDTLEQLRVLLYPRLATIASRWNRLMGIDVDYPEELSAFLARCHKAGQRRPTPLILRYAEGDYNCLHQDLYGEQVFPLQMVILLAKPGKDFTGGEFVMTERGPSQQRADVISMRQGDGVVFTVNRRPVQGSRSTRKVVMRHGVSRIRSGLRHTVGVIFHDAR